MSRRSRLAAIDVAICVTISVLVFLIGSIWVAATDDPAVEPVYDPDPNPVVVPVVPPGELDDYLACYHDPATEPWVPNLEVPATGECP